MPREQTKSLSGRSSTPWWFWLVPWPAWLFVVLYWLRLAIFER